jgi:hypothetical protein
VTDFHHRAPDRQHALDQGFNPPTLKKGDLTYEWVNNVNATRLTQENNDLVYKMWGGEDRAIFHDAVTGRPAGKEDTPQNDPRYPIRQTVEENARQNIIGVYLPAKRN